MIDAERPKEELVNELLQLKQEIYELKLDNDTFRKRMMNCEAIFESSPVAMFIIDKTTNIKMLNLAAVKLCGGSEEAILQHRPGNALRCVHSAKDPRGCGYAPDCKTCEVRNAIEALIDKGIEFFVKDSGIGIASEFHDDIFERFRQVDETKTRKYGGNSLGLAIYKNLVEVLGGKIRVESEIGKGSKFSFSLPNN